MRQDRHRSRAERLAQPLALEALRQSAADLGVCVRPIPVRVLDHHTGRSEIRDLDCGATLTAACRSCAEKQRRLRLEQIRTGWHLDAEPVPVPAEPTGQQRQLVEQRACLTATGASDAVLDDADADITDAGLRGSLAGATRRRRSRSTRRRIDAGDLPTRPVAATTIGRVYEGKDGRTYRPSLFWTVTLPSYGRISDGAPVDPATYDYRQAARDAIHVGRLFDRTIQNLRRYVGYDAQYVAAVEPQRRVAPHVHVAMRGTLSRAELRAVLAATYEQVWWPSTDHIETRPLRWQSGLGYCYADTGDALPTWDQALDATDEPYHVLRWGCQMDAQGVLAGSPQAERCLRYLSKYLPKSVADCYRPTTSAQHDHVGRLVDALRYEPCSPRCANWLRYGVQPQRARDGMAPGYCLGKAHRPTHLVYGGRRVLVSRKWSGKTLADHRRDRRAWVLATLGKQAADLDPARYTVTLAGAADADVEPVGLRIMRAIETRVRRRAELAAARAQCSATGIAA